ncbi:MAG: hypothetical protein Q9N34_04400 [Aquificota bacterium]|nr:hypothetical protein [Aquificota bacterium]
MLPQPRSVALLRRSVRDGRAKDVEETGQGPDTQPHRGGCGPHSEEVVKEAEGPCPVREALQKGVPQRREGALTYENVAKGHGRSSGRTLSLTFEV